MMRTMSVVNLIYGGVCANMLFGDLFQSRMCNALHAMPMRRESWFFTHVCAGLLFSLVPNVVTTVFQMVLLGKYFYIAPLWLVVVTGQFLFFFGVGIFAVMCAGNRLGMGAGWYDRSFAFRRSRPGPPWLVGAAFSRQQVEALDRQDWDVPVDAVCTELATHLPDENR